MVELRGLTRKFGDFVAVNNLHLQVSQGTIFGFLGPNGAGKSTTVKMLTGILKPSAGDALIDGLSIQTSPLEIKQKIGAQFYRFSAGGSPADGIMGMLFGSLPGLIMVYSGSVWTVILLMVVYSALYYLSVTHSGRRLEARREELRQLLL
jgi:ABC-type dipeptide/oligopeptide/nickel transport system ATPase component